jgi:hypothetical protein
VVMAFRRRFGWTLAEELEEGRGGARRLPVRIAGMMCGGGESSGELKF